MFAHAEMEMTRPRCDGGDLSIVRLEVNGERHGQRRAVFA